MLELGNGHVVVEGKSISSVSKVVLSRPGDLLAIGSRDSVSGGIHPGVTLSSAIRRVVLGGLSLRVSGRGIGAISLRLNVLRVSLVERAKLGV